MQSIPLISNSPHFFFPRESPKEQDNNMVPEKSLIMTSLNCISSWSFLHHCTIACVPSQPPELSPCFRPLQFLCFLPLDPAGHQICHPALHSDTKTLHWHISPSQKMCHLALLPMVNTSITLPFATATRVVNLPSKLVLVHLQTAYVSTHCVSHFILPLQSAFHFIFTPSDIHHSFGIRNSSEN